MPPSRTVALIEYLEPTEARRGFKHLAYTKFHHVPLYLEWAPLSIIGERQVGGEEEENVPTPTNAEAKAASEFCQHKDAISIYVLTFRFQIKISFLKKRIWRPAKEPRFISRT